MKLSNHLLGFCIQILLIKVLSSPVEYVTQNVRNFKRKCGFDDKVLNTKSANRLKRFTKYGNAWENKIVTWNFPNLNYPKSQHDLYYIKLVIHDSFKIWEKHVNDIAFQETDDLSADIILSFGRMEHGDGSSFDGPSGIFAHAFPPSSGLGGDVHFDEDEYWNFKGDDENPESIDFFYVALHEIGHALGLGHSTVKEAVMFSFYSKYRHDLHADDILGIQSFYGVGEFSKINPVTGISPRTTTRTTTRTTQKTIESTNSYQSPDHQIISIKPNKCSIQFDAISVVRNEIFIFNTRYMWRFREGDSVSEEPIEIDSMWKGLPKNVIKIDAFYENVQQNQFWMFVDKEIYVFGLNRNRKIELLFIRNLSNLQLPSYVQKVDAIFTWGTDGRTFIFADDKYWRMDEMAIKVEQMEPKPMNIMWKNVDKIDTGFQFKEKTYFFKGNNFYEFDEEKQTINLDQPQNALEFWMNCPPFQEYKVVISSAITVQCSLVFIFLVSILCQMF